MRILILILMLSFTASAELPAVQRLLNRQKQIQQDGVHGFILHRMPLIPLDTVRRIVFDTVQAIEGKSVGDKSADVPVAAPTPVLHPIEHMSGSYVKWEAYYQNSLEMQQKLIFQEQRIASLEKDIGSLATATDKIQTSTVDNREFVLKLIEVFLTGTIGGGGAIGAVFAYLRKKKGRKDNGPDTAKV